MSDIAKLYHWANIVLNPIILVLSLTAGAAGEGAEFIFALGAGWTLLSAVLNEKIRSWVLGAFASIMGATFFLSCIGSIMGIFVLIFVVAFGLIAGFYIVLPLLWILSVKDIIEEQRGLV
jgi:hypothetical protein